MSAAVEASPDDPAVTEPEARPFRRPGRVPVVASLVALGAIVLPPGPVARWLAGDGSAVIGSVRTGVIILKALVVANAIALPLLAGLFARATPGRPLIGPVYRKQPVTPTLLGLLAVTLAMGLVVRLVHLGEGMWHDEIATLVEIGRLSPGQVITTYAQQNQHILYSVLANVTFAVTGESTWALRLPAALMGAASLVAVFWFGSIVTTRREALLATLLLTVSYHHVWFSQNARGYTGMMLFALIASGLFVRLLTGGSRRAWPLVIGYAIMMALAVWTHLTAAFIAAAHFAVWAVLAVRSRRRLNGAWPWAPALAIVLAGSFTLLLYALVLPQMMETLFAPATAFEGQTPWANPLWLLAETVRGASRGLPGGWIGLVAGTTVALTGTVSYLRRSATATMLMVLPGVLTAVALVVTAHNLWPRFFFFAAGFAVLIAVRGTFALASLLPGGRGRSRAVATAVLVLAAAGSAITVPRAWAPKQDYAGALEYVRDAAAAGDAIIATGLAAYAYDEWLGTSIRSVGDVAELDRIEGSSERTWLLYTMPDHLAGLAPDVWSRIESDYREIVAFPGTVAGGTVHVMMRR